MQTITILDFAVIAAPLTLAALALLFFGRRHIYRQMDDIAEAAKARSSKRPCPHNGADDCSCDSPATLHRAAATGFEAPKPSRFTGDLQGLEDALVEFFASSKASSGILTVLAAHGKPVAFKVLVEEIRTEQELRRDGEDLPTSALRAVLSILQVVRLVRMNRDGFSITDLGREVYRRMNSQLKHRTPSAQVNLSAVRQHGRRDHSIATSRASSSSPLADGGLSGLPLSPPASAVNLLHSLNGVRGMAGSRLERFNLTERISRCISKMN